MEPSSIAKWNTDTKALALSIFIECTQTIKEMRSGMIGQWSTFKAMEAVQPAYSVFTKSMIQSLMRPLVKSPAVASMPSFIAVNSKRVIHMRECATCMRCCCSAGGWLSQLQNLMAGPTHVDSARTFWCCNQWQ
jgi:hypothetical protein